MSSNFFAKPCNHLTFAMIPFPERSKVIAPSNLGQLMDEAASNTVKVRSQTARPDTSQQETKSGPKVKLETDFCLNNERTKYLLESGFMSDVAFLVDNEETKQEEKINCHKLILATRSRVFARLFVGPNAEKSNEIKINDVKANDFRNLLKFIYYDDTEVAIQSFVSTLVAAEKYSVRPLSKALIDQIKRFEGDEICILLKHLANQRLNNKDLQREVAKKHQMDTKRIIDSEEFLNLSFETIRELLSNETLSVKESELFEAVLEWAKNQCLMQRLEANPSNLKRILSRLTYLISYQSMSLEEFANGPGKMRTLSDAELVDLFLHLALKDQSAVCLPKQIALKRQPVPVYEVSLLGDGLRDRESGSVRNSTGEFVDFRTSCEVYLRGVRNSIQVDKKERKLIIYKKSASDQLKLIASKTIITSCFEPPSSDKSNTKTKFHYPVLIEPNVDYRLELCWKSVKHCEKKQPVGKTSLANVEFVFTGSGGLSYMEKLIFHKFGSTF